MTNDEARTCEFCGAGPVTFVHQPQRWEKWQEPTELCEICSSTVAGNVAITPQAYNTDRTIIKLLVQLEWMRRGVVPE